MTRGQDALLMDGEETAAEGEELVVVDLRQFKLPVLLANEQETQAHEQALLDLDKASKGKTLWRPSQPA